MSELPPLKLTLEDGRRAAGAHALERGHQLRLKYGNFIDPLILNKILMDRDFVRYPTCIEFSNRPLEEGMFGYAERIGEKASDGYIIFIHPYFKNRPGDLPALVLYHLVTVNYGEFATYNEAEEFGSSAMGLSKEEYYQTICRLADSIPK